jgi:LacI family transcriptional regulator
MTMKPAPPPLPKHRAIYRELKADILAGKYPPGSQLPSETQLVKHYGVSRPTAARALLDLQHDGLLARRAGSGSYARDMGSAAEAGLRMFGLLIPGLGSTEIFEPICGEIASLARAHESGLLWGGSTHPLRDTDASREHAEQLCQQFIERKVAGVFFAPFELTPEPEQANRRIADLLRKAGIPVVLLDRDFTPFPQRSDFDLVSLDNFAGGYLLAEHLLKLGCRRLAFVARPLSAATVDTRIAGAREAMARRGLAPETEWVQRGDPSDPKFVCQLVAKGRPDAIICANDNTAAVLMQSLEHAGLHVPRDMRVVGFDDVKYATLLSVPLTTIHQPCRDIGALAFRAMMERIAEPTFPARTLTLTPRLVVRESCGAYLPRSR